MQQIGARMETCRVNVCYRPIRIAWVVHSEDRDAIRRVVKLTNAFWGGRYNPIVFADQRENAKQLIDLFRADHIVPLGDAPELQTLRDEYPHLINPFFHDQLFVDRQFGQARSYLLDVQNALHYWTKQRDWSGAREHGFRRIVWDNADPMADAWLFQFGAFPNADEIGIDYTTILRQPTEASDVRIEPAAPLPDGVSSHLTLSYINRYGLYRHYSVRAGRENPGFFVGDVSSNEDLVTFWNLRAADIPLVFVDLAHLERFAGVLPSYKYQLQTRGVGTPEPLRHLAIWARDDASMEPGRARLGDDVHVFSRVTPELWNGLNVRPPMMVLGEASALGVRDESKDRIAVSFTLNEKPFSGEPWFYTQHLVASLKLYGVSDEQHTFTPPYVPELNEMAGRAMLLEYDKMRLEPDRVGVIVNATDHDVTLRALSVSEVIRHTFALCGLNAEPSNGGLITRQLASRMGGYNGGRAFKIPGVRRLIKTYGPNASFSKRAALQTIGRANSITGARFSDHERLYIEPRRAGPLTPIMVFEHLVAKGLFRIGVDLLCPSCNLPSWIPLETLTRSNTCELCGATHDSARQLVNAEFSYRRSGVLGIEKNAQGAIPVVLLLQQLSVNLRHIGHEVLLAPSYNLRPMADRNLPECETDFVVIYPETYPDPPSLIIGECKDEGDRINQRDIDNLRAVADAVPRRFEPYILLARLTPFSPEEIALARTLNAPFRRRAILLSARELEPYHIYDRVNAELNTRFRGTSPEELAMATHRIYFERLADEQETAASNRADDRPG
ncbi:MULTISPECIES: hypothetical protein [Bradyrhizobium]|uniref:hypothetical protein n=1 Tax=Bradyrhizobium elkanii TaxID=29448 RepID=UPI0003FEBDDA|nr:hypothetical protein [Bradyrhizobium elkanii]